jgi:hypothetical protein
MPAKPLKGSRSVSQFDLNARHTAHADSFSQADDSDNIPIWLRSAKILSGGINAAEEGKTVSPNLAAEVSNPTMKV